MLNTTYIRIYTICLIFKHIVDSLMLYSLMADEIILSTDLSTDNVENF